MAYLFTEEARQFSGCCNNNFVSLIDGLLFTGLFATLGSSIDGLEAIMHSKVSLKDKIVTIISILCSR